MRLTERERQAILQSIRRFFPDAKRILLFGSRRDSRPIVQVARQTGIPLEDVAGS